MKNKKGKLFLVSAISAAVGAIGGILFAPHSGKKSRKDITLIAKNIADQVKDSATDTKKRVEAVFGEATDAAKQTYRKIQATLSSKIASVKVAGKQIDKAKYGQIVDGVVDDFKSDLKATKDGAKKISVQLKKDWLKVKKALNKDTV